MQASIDASVEKRFLEAKNKPGVSDCCRVERRPLTSLEFGAPLGLEQAAVKVLTLSVV